MSVMPSTLGAGWAGADPVTWPARVQLAVLFVPAPAAEGRRALGSATMTATVFRTTLRALWDMVTALGTALLALGVLIWLLGVAALSLIGIGLLLVPSALRLLHGVADLERARLSRRGPEVHTP